MNKYVTITQVPDRNAEMLTWLEQNEIVPGNQVKLVSKDSFDGGLTIELGERTMQIAESVAKLVYVSKEDEI